MTMSDLNRHIHQVARLNSFGVALLASGSETEAADLFEKGLIALKQCLAMEARRESMPIGCLNDPNPVVSRSKDYQQRLLGLDHFMLDGNDLRFVEPNRFIVSLPEHAEPASFVFHRAVTFCPAAHDGRRLRHHDYVLYFSIICFNLALSYHQRGNVCSHTAESHRLRALKFYQLTAEILLDVPRCRTSMLLNIASVNNMSQIYYERGEFLQARKGLDHLSCLLDASPNDDPDAMKEDAFLPENDMHQLCLNILLLTEPNAARAA